MDSTIGQIRAEVARLAAEHSRRVTREESAMAGQLAGDIVEAFLSLGRKDRALAAKNGKYLGRDLVSWLLSADMPKPEARATSWDADDWAGPIAGPTEIERTYGISRSNLYKWQKAGRIITFDTGRNKPAFPVRQFVNGRPVKRISEIVERIGDERKAWFWLCTVHPKLEEAPIERLRRGDEKSVVLVMP